MKEMIKDYIRDAINAYRDHKDSKKRQKNIDHLLKVRVSSHRSTYDNFIINQTPKRSGIIGNTIFYNSFNRDYDFVINNPNKFLRYQKDKSFLLHIEPPSYIKKSNLSDQKILNKFSKVYTTDPSLIEKNDSRYVASPPFVHWHLGANYHIGNIDKEKIIDYDFLSQVSIPDKEVNLATLNSNLLNIQGHQDRADFIERLCKMQYDFNLYGGNKWSNFQQYKNNAPDGKWFPFSKSRYVLVIENEKAPYYWSEKLTDTMLCYATPIYYGCTNISDYFPKGSYYQIDIKRKDSIDELISIVESDFHEQNIESLQAARELILGKYNMFSFMNRVINEHV